MWKNKKRPLVYLAGAIENAPDAGSKWRRDISEFLESQLNHAVFNPTLEENHVLTNEEFNNFRKWKSSDLTRFRKVIHKIIKTDLTILTEKVDYIICLWDEHVLAGGGTHGELTMAFWYKIPVYMITEIPVEKMSSWVVGCTTELFYDFDSLKKYLMNRYNK